MRAYVSLPIVFLSNLPTWQYVILGAGALAGGAALVLASRQRAFSAAVTRWLPAGVAAAMWALALYALLLRHPGGKLAAHNAYALRTFTDYYLTLPGLIAALIGFTLVAPRAFRRDPAFMATLTIFCCFFFYKIRIVTDHFWMARRFLPVILPGALMLIAAAALSTAGGGWRGARAVRPVIGLVFLSLLALHYARASGPVVRHQEYAGLIPNLERLAGSIGDNDLVVAESRDTGDDLHLFALPLAYVYARHVLVLNSARPDKPTFAAFLEWAHMRYRRVLFLGGGGTDLLSHRYGVQPLSSERFQVPEYDAPHDAYPRFVRQKEFDFGLYAFTSASPREGQWFALDVGLRDDLHVLRFHAKEVSEGRTFRWTRATSYIAVTVLHPSAREVTLWMNDGGRPSGGVPADVSVFLHNQLLGTVRAGARFTPYTLPIPPDLARRAAAFPDPVELKLVTPVWNPQRVLGGSDDRDLGVMVDRVEVR
jgi:hypothetical protein